MHDIARMDKKVVVSHPGRQHSHQLATALAQVDMLEHYYSGVPAGCRTAPWYLRSMKTNYADFHGELPAELCTCLPVSPMTRQLALRSLPLPAAVAVGHWADGVFDMLVRNRLARRSGVGAVVCYENAAERTFAWARKRKITTVLDAASVHHTLQDQAVPFTESRQSHARIVARKAREIELADWIITTSPLAFESYLAVGVRPDRLLMVPMGVDVECFRPPAVRHRAPELRFVFVGRASRLKGIDLLLESHRRLIEAELPVHLTLIGDRDDNLQWTHPPSVTTIPRLRTQQLAAEITKHDVLVLPSRFDSFGMVVSEAMAAGLPVIVSPNAGSKMLVQPEENGLIMEEVSIEALESCMRWFLLNRDRMESLSQRAQESSRAYTWNTYRSRIQSVFSDILH